VAAVDDINDNNMYNQALVEEYKHIQKQLEKEKKRYTKAVEELKDVTSKVEEPHTQFMAPKEEHNLD